MWSKISGGNYMPRKGENIRKRKDGRWEGRYIKTYNSLGKAVYGSVYARTYVDVKRKLIEMNKLVLDHALPQKQQKVAFREVLYLWLENNKIKLKLQTYADYKYMIESHILPWVGSIYISDVDSNYINSFLTSKFNDGRLDGKGGLSTSYIKKLSFILCSALDFAVKENYCSPIRGDIIHPQNKKKELEVLSIAEQLILEQYIMTDFDERKLGVLLSLYAGLRIGEVCGLKWSDIDFQMQTIHVRHTVERIKNIDADANDSKTKLVLGDAKTYSSDRIIPITPKLMSLLESYKQNKNMFLLRGNSYEYTDPRTYQYSFQGYLKSCKLRPINYHALRHTFATRCIESGMDIKSLSEILGHASVNITLNTYVHSSLEHKRNQLQAMSVYCGQ